MYIYIYIYILYICYVENISAIHLINSFSLYIVDIINMVITWAFYYENDLWKVLFKYKLSF